MHEWKETFGYNPHTGKYDVEGKTHSPTTWIFEAGSFVPCGKITNGKHYSIITDHLGTLIEAYNQEGELIWEREQDLYGNSRQGFAKENFRCPFKYQGQYYDSEVELCYNRFRYYHPETGRYISEDPIKLLGGFNVFAYVSDTNAWVDLLGLFRKPINWLSKDNININMDHILSNHTETGSGFIQSSRMGGEKDSFDPNLSKTQIEKKIREAYAAAYSREKVHKEYDKNNEEFHTKHKLRGLSKDGTIIEMWYNSDKKTIETAYPKGHKNQYNKK